MQVNHSARTHIETPRGSVTLSLAFGLAVLDFEGVDVSTGLLFEPKPPLAIRDAVHRSLYNGVHHGLDGFPLGGHISVQITRFKIQLAQKVSAADFESHIAPIIERFMGDNVACAWQALQRVARLKAT